MSLLPDPARRLLWAAMPAAFVLIWSCGWVAAKVGMQYAEPFHLLAARFVLLVPLMALLALATGAPWPRRPGEILHIAAAGFLMQGLYYGTVYLSMAWGVGVGTSAIIVSMQPVLTAIAAGPLLGERVTARQWAGLGLGAVGVALVVENKLALGLGTGAGVAMSFAALVAVTAGTLYQKRHCPTIDPRSGGAIQFLVGAIVAVPAALLLEEGRVEWTWQLVASFAFLLVMLSMVAISLLTLMIKRGEAYRVATLLFLVPPMAGLIAYALLGETMTGTAILGVAVAVAGVALVLVRR